MLTRSRKVKFKCRSQKRFKVSSAKRIAVNRDRNITLSTNTDDLESQLYNIIDKLDKFVNDLKMLLKKVVELQLIEIKWLRRQLIELKWGFESINDNSDDSNLKDILQKKIDLVLEEVLDLCPSDSCLQYQIEEMKRKLRELKLNVEKRTKSGTTIDTNPSENREANREAVTEFKSKLTEILQNELKCAICKNMFIMPVITNCSHTFCLHCLAQWRKHSHNCPICRTTITCMINNPELSLFLANVEPLVTPKVMENWKKQFEEVTGSGAAIASRMRMYMFIEI